MSLMITRCDVCSHVFVIKKTERDRLVCRNCGGRVPFGRLFEAFDGKRRPGAYNPER